MYILRNAFRNLLLVLASLFFLFCANYVFAANSAPAVGTLTPSSGTSGPGSAVSFTTTFSDPDGYQNISQALILINTGINGKNCLYGIYNTISGFWIMPDSASGWQGGYAAGSSNTIENSYVKLDCSKSAVTGSGNNLTIVWNVTFKTTFTGSKKVYLKVVDYGKKYAGWTQAGTWAINKVLPKIKIILPKDNASINQDAVKICGTISKNVTSVDINGMKAIIGNGQFAIDEFPVSIGKNYITATAVASASNFATAQVSIDVRNLPKSELLLDDFSDTRSTKNKLGWWTGDNQSCTINVDENGYHKISWNNISAYWYSDLWDPKAFPGGTDVSYYGILSFRIKGQAGGENFSVEVEDIPHGPNFNKRIAISNYIQITTQWKEVTIPLSDFTSYGIWKTQVRSIVFNFDKTKQGTIYIDNIRFRPALIDTFADALVNMNSLGNPTGTSGSSVQHVDKNGYHYIEWTTINDYWYTDLWNGSLEYNAAGFNYLYLRLRGKNGGEKFSVELTDDSSTSTCEIASYKNITKSWNYLYIPLKDFSTDKSKLRRLRLLFNKTQKGIIYIDKIGLTNTNKISAKPQSSGPVKIIGKQLIVNNAPFEIKGIAYQPIPIGSTPNMNNVLYQDQNIYNRDLSKLRELGCNTIRIWKKANSHNFLKACYNNGSSPIYVIMGFPIEYINLKDTGIRDLIKQEFATYVKEYKSEPSVLMWALGNEVNMRYKGDMKDWYSLANELAMIAYQIEGQTYHPVAIVNKDIDHIGQQSFSSTDDLLNYIDIWGITAYRGLSYRGFFNTWFHLSAKPLLITEYGADSWSSGTEPSQGYEDTATQAQYYLNNWTEIENAVGCLGGVLMEYTDEWWKVVGGNYNVQDYGGFQFRYDQPDNFSNEEFWGLFKIQDKDNNPDILIPKKAYEVMKLGFGNRPYTETAMAWEFNKDGVSEGWAPQNSLSSFVVQGGTLSTNVSGTNPIMDSPSGLIINGLLHSGIDIRMKITKGLKARIFWKRQGETVFTAANSKAFVILGDGKFHDYHIYLGDHPNWNGTVVQLRLVPTSVPSGQIEIDYIRIVQGVIPADYIPPPDITKLSALNGNEMVTLKWTASLNTQGDLLDQLLYIDKGNGFSVLQNLGPNVTMHKVTGLVNGVTYTFKITCIDKVLNESSGAAVKAVPRDTTAPEDITNLTASAGDTKVTLNWTLSINSEKDLKDQILYINNGSGYNNGQKLGATVTQYTVSGLNNEQLYTLKITCIDEVPNESTGTTVQAIPQSVKVPRIQITNPKNGLITKNTVITVSGTVNNNSAVVTVNGISATVTSGAFTANNVSLSKEEANQITAKIEYNGQTGYSSITVYRDTTPPELAVTDPCAGEMVVGYP